MGIQASWSQLPAEIRQQILVQALDPDMTSHPHVTFQRESMKLSDAIIDENVILTDYRRFTDTYLAMLEQHPLMITAFELSFVSKAMSVDLLPALRKIQRRICWRVQCELNLNVFLLVKAPQDGIHGHWPLQLYNGLGNISQEMWYLNCARYHKVYQCLKEVPTAHERIAHAHGHHDAMQIPVNCSPPHSSAAFRTCLHPSNKVWMRKYARSKIDAWVNPVMSIITLWTGCSVLVNTAIYLLSYFWMLRLLFIVTQWCKTGLTGSVILCTLWFWTLAARGVPRTLEQWRW